MIEEDAPVPPNSFLTREEEETLTRLRQERQDAVREERELLLAVRSQAPADYRCEGDFGEWESMFEGLSVREREGASLLKRDDLDRWGEIQERGFAAVRAQHELTQAVLQRAKRGERP